MLADSAAAGTGMPPGPPAHPAAGAELRVSGQLIQVSAAGKLSGMLLSPCDVRLKRSLERAGLGWGRVAEPRT